MKNFLKNIMSLSLLLSFLVVLLVPSTLANNHGLVCDADGDGYIVIPENIMNEIASDANYNSNGNYSPAEWQDFFKLYKNGQLTDSEICEGLNFKKGAEPSRCDSVSIGSSSNVYDPSVQKTPLRGTQVNPGALDIAGNSIDEDCDGKDATLLGKENNGKSLAGLADNAITLLGRIVVTISIAIMIWGGVLYATAAGDEAKTSKARKAIIGSIIGLIVRLLAPAIVNWVAANLV